MVRVGIGRFDTYLIHRRSAVEINLLTVWHVWPAPEFRLYQVHRTKRVDGHLRLHDGIRGPQVGCTVPAHEDAGMLDSPRCVRGLPPDEGSEELVGYWRRLRVLSAKSTLGIFQDSRPDVRRAPAVWETAISPCA